MSYFSVDPEVAGGWGKNTVFERKSGGTTVVHKLHYEFEGWLGDELLESTPCFIVTDQLANEIEKAHLSGVVFDQVEVTTSGQFHELYPDRQLPGFLWLKVVGAAGHDDFGFGNDLRLVVSDRALEVLQQVGISHASISPFNAESS